ncbi:serine/threonine protein kinase [[Emmonsia] crescens]|uniref:Serine/threonine protein kinase n=1 Tax=[Emmonsia] crescens TaxID=73230 RepID=A0A2B7Z3U6_9EURO|nr:serine/threonine protein kinase [Emmonsia crescens]
MSSSLRNLSRGLKFVGKRGQTYVLLDPLIQRKGRRCHVWSASTETDETDQFVIKQPDENDGPGWPNFTKEVQMQEYFRNSKHLRRMLDMIPPSSDSEPSMMVLEPFGKSLWDARMTRPLSTGEIRSVMRGVLFGLGTIHTQGYVYTDLKMENILVGGFENEKPGSGEALVTKIADLGMIERPSCGTITSIAYRSPEVYFNKPWTTATDIWSWGMIYCHLLQAQVDFDKPGMFDSIAKGTLTDKANAVRAEMAREFELHLLDCYTSDPESRALLPPEGEPKDELDHWAAKLHSKNIPERDIEVVFEALRPLPEERPTAIQLLNSGYL